MLSLALVIALVYHDCVKGKYSTQTFVPFHGFRPPLGLSLDDSTLRGGSGWEQLKVLSQKVRAKIDI